MIFSSSDISHLLLALVLLLIFSHGMAYFFRYFAQPPVIGEIVSGLILGPTFVGALWPRFYEFFFLNHEPTRIVLESIYQLGLLLLMFCSGVEIQSTFQKSERKTVFFISVLGIIFPLIGALLAIQLVDPTMYMGHATHHQAFTLIFAIAVAVTSIPVISRILLDLGILNTVFSKIVLSAAVLEDIILYIILTITLSLVSQQHGETFGLQALLTKSNTVSAYLYSIAIPLLFFVFSLRFGPVIYQWAHSFRYNILNRNSPVAHLLIFLLVMTGIAIFLGMTPMFGAFMAGIISSRAGAIQSQKDQIHPSDAIKNFSFAFFIPLYFAMVGLKLDLRHSFDILFFIGFLFFASFIKGISVYVGAWLAKESKASCLNLAIAMNARGGPGIVLASLAYDAQIINSSFYAMLVMLSIVTSMLTGSWLGYVKKRGLGFR